MAEGLARQGIDVQQRPWEPAQDRGRPVGPTQYPGGITREVPPPSPTPGMAQAATSIRPQRPPMGPGVAPMSDARGRMSQGGPGAAALNWQAGQSPLAKPMAPTPMATSDEDQS
jgi:hypothetical protein